MAAESWPIESAGHLFLLFLFMPSTLIDTLYKSGSCHVALAGNLISKVAGFKFWGHIWQRCGLLLVLCS